MARSRWTKSLRDKYSIPRAICEQKSRSVLGKHPGTISPGLKNDTKIKTEDRETCCDCCPHPSPGPFLCPVHFWITPLYLICTINRNARITQLTDNIHWSERFEVVSEVPIHHQLQDYHHLCGIECHNESDLRLNQTNAPLMEHTSAFFAKKHLLACSKCPFNERLSDNICKESL